VTGASGAPGGLVAWDSAFFGRRIGRVEPAALADPAALGRWISTERLDAVYCLVDAADVAAQRHAVAARFRMVDVRMEFARSLAGVEPASGLRPATEADIPALERIAAASFHGTRYTSDPGFPADAVARLYPTWIANSVRGYADAVLVAEHAGALGGFISCHRGEAGEGSIGLVGVAAAARGGGVGARLVHGARGWLAGAGCRAASVVTQGSNVAAQRLYQRAGFLTRRVSLWYHRWTEDST
jgi:dTDP-4-amino-4,6-dideoxy-D-galactose acyltransferase